MIRSLKEFAAHLELSPTTVSRALNGYPEVSERTRQRVLEAAQQLNYQPNPTAQRLATGRADALGVLLPIQDNMLENPIVTDLLTGISETAGESGLAVHLLPTLKGQERTVCERVIRSGAVDALVLLSPVFDDPATADLTELPFPVVTHGLPMFGQEVASLSVDNHGAAANGIAHLIAFGHRRIALLNGEESLAYGRDRREGYLAALAAAGLPVDPALMTQGRHTYARGLADTERLLALPEPPTAFFCSSILQAVGAVQALRTAGLRIPEDVSLIAYDDLVAALPAALAAPDLTVLRSSIRLAGRRVAGLAGERVRGVPASQLKEVWDVPLVPGRTTGPVKT